MRYSWLSTRFTVLDEGFLSYQYFLSYIRDYVSSNNKVLGWNLISYSVDTKICKDCHLYFYEQDLKIVFVIFNSTHHRKDYY